MLLSHFRSWKICTAVVGLIMLTSQTKRKEVTTAETSRTKADFLGQTLLIGKN